MSLFAYIAYDIALELRSRSMIVCQSLRWVGLTHASSVIAPPRSSDELAGMVTQLPLAVKLIPAPNLPFGVRVAPVIVPLLPAGEESVTLVPDGSSKPQAPTSPFGSTAGLLSVTLTG